MRQITEMQEAEKKKQLQAERKKRLKDLIRQREVKRKEKEAERAKKLIERRKERLSSKKKNMLISLPSMKSE